MKAWPC